MEKKDREKRGVYQAVSVEMTPSRAMTIIHGVLNKRNGRLYPIVETAEEIAFALGFECNPTNTKARGN